MLPYILSFKQKKIKNYRRDIFYEEVIHSIALSMNSIKRLAYCSGSHVDIPSTLLPYFTVFAAFAAFFLFKEVKQSIDRNSEIIKFFY